MPGCERIIARKSDPGELSLLLADFEMIRPSKNTADKCKEQKRARVEFPSTDSKRSKGNSDLKKTPTKIVTWNANGLIPRCKSNTTDLRRLVEETDQPDIICIQEARVKGDANHQPMREEVNEMGSVMKDIFSDYQHYWSLTIGQRYSGTLTLVHKRICVQDVAFTPDAAIDTLIRKSPTKKSRAELNLTPITLDGAKTTSNRSKQSQKTLQSFFASKKPTKEHTSAGRFQWLCFQDWDLLQTYVPNNGLTEESRSRRKDWDDGMLEFVRQRMELANDRPFLWCGDVNCTSSSKDGSHSTPTIEYWRSHQAMIYPHGTPEEHIGTPGFTPAERERFRIIVTEGKLNDVWRHLHPDGDDRCVITSANPWELPNYTWRGTKGKYYGRGMRIDGFWTTSNLLKKVKDCKILGWGSDLHGLFCGSDHCATLLELQSHDDQIDDGKSDQEASSNSSPGKT